MRILILVSVLFSSNLYSSESKEVLRIIDKDKLSGVEATIRKFTPDDKNFAVSKTGKDGYILKKFDCELLEKINIEPKDTNYYKKDIDCPLTEAVIALRSAKYEFNLLANAKLSFNKGDFGTAALAFNEAAARVNLTSADIDVRNKLTLSTFDSAAKYFNVSSSTKFDPQQNKLVMSEELQAAIIEQQKARGLEETGRLDFKTLESISSKKLSEVMFKKIK